MKLQINKTWKIAIASILVLTSINGYSQNQISSVQLSDSCAAAVEAKAAIGLNYSELLTRSCSVNEIKLMASGTGMFKQQIISIQSQLAKSSSEKPSEFTTFVANNDIGSKLIMAGSASMVGGAFVIMGAYKGTDESLDANTARERAKVARAERQMKVAAQTLWLGPALIALGFVTGTAASNEIKTYAVKKQDERNLKAYLADLQARVETIQTLNTRLSVNQ